MSYHQNDRTVERIWAPWRAPYIQNIGKKNTTCLFCRVAKQRQDRKNLVFLRTEHSVGLLNLYPYNNGHVMVAPVRHVRAIELLPEEDWFDLMRAMVRAKEMVSRVLKPHGFNIGFNEGRVAGAGIDQHVHMHIVPRWNGDSNFMPVLARTKVISQSLEELLKALRETSE